MFGKQSATSGNHWNIVRGIHCEKISLLDRTSPKILTERHIWTFKSSYIFLLQKKVFFKFNFSIFFIKKKILTPPE